MYRFFFEYFSNRHRFKIKKKLLHKTLKSDSTKRCIFSCNVLLFSVGTNYLKTMNYYFMFRLKISEAG